MNYKYLGREKNTGTIEFTVDKAEFESYIQKAYIKTRGKYSLQGFRKGKAPRKLIEKAYGEGTFYDEALNILLPEMYDKAVAELALNPVARPDIDIVDIGTDKDLVFNAKVTLKPEVVLGAYKGLEIKKIEDQVTEEDVMKELNSSLDKNARLVAVQRPVASGDVVTFDYKGFVDGAAFDGGEATNQTLTLGENKFIPGFEDAMIGKEVGSDFTIEVKFPEDYHAQELMGKDAQFEIFMHDAKEKQLPELNDDFAKETSEFDTLEELKASIRENLEKANKESVENYVKAKALELAVEGSQIDLPEEMIESELDYMVRDFEYQLMYQGIDFNQYMDITGSTVAAIREQMKDEAVKRVLGSLVLEKIGSEENISVEESEIESEIEYLSKMYGKSIEETKKVYAQDNFEYIKDTIKTRKTVEFLASNANIIE